MNLQSTSSSRSPTETLKILEKRVESELCPRFSRPTERRSRSRVVTGHVMLFCFSGSRPLLSCSLHEPLKDPIPLQFSPHSTLIHHTYPHTHTFIMKLLTKEEEDAHYRYDDFLAARAVSNRFRIFPASCHTNNPVFPTAPSSRAAPSVAFLVLPAVQRASCSLRDVTTQSATLPSP